MTAKVVPLPRKPPHPGELMALVRRLAKNGAISFSTHAFDRSDLREIDLPDVQRYLQQGEMKGGVTAGKRPGEWKCKIVCQPENTSRWLGIPLVVIGEVRLLVTTLEWEDA